MEQKLFLLRTTEKNIRPPPLHHPTWTLWPWRNPRNSLRASVQNDWTAMTSGCRFDWVETSAITIQSKDFPWLVRTVSTMWRGPPLQSTSKIFLFLLFLIPLVIAATFTGNASGRTWLRPQHRHTHSYQCDVSCSLIRTCWGKYTSHFSPGREETFARFFHFQLPGICYEPAHTWDLSRARSHLGSVTSEVTPGICSHLG